MMVNDKILKNIQLVITDVDGVLTDGGLYYTEEGMTFKKYNVKDGMAVHILRDYDIKCGIISTDVSGIITKRAEKLKLDFCYIGIWEKEKKMLEICNEYNLKPDEVAFIGDDINDLGIIDLAGFSACPKNAVEDVKQKADYICSRNGGDAVFREFVELIVLSKKMTEK